MSKTKNIFTISDTENASYDGDIKKLENIPNKVKKVYQKKSIFSDDEMEQLTFISKLDKFEEDINNMYDTMKKLKGFAKEIRQTYQQDIIKIRKMRRHKLNSSETGFNKKCEFPDKLCELIGVDKGTMMTKPEYTSKIYQELKKRGLVYAYDKRIYRVDNQFSEILGIKESVNKSTEYPDEYGLNIGTMQTYINNALKKYKKNNNEVKIKVSKKVN